MGNEDGRDTTNANEMNSAIEREPEVWNEQMLHVRKFLSVLPQSSILTNTMLDQKARCLSQESFPVGVVRGPNQAGSSRSPRSYFRKDVIKEPNNPFCNKVEIPA